MYDRNKPYLIAEILVKRGLPDAVVTEITAIDEDELFLLKRLWNIENKSS